MSTPTRVLYGAADRMVRAEFLRGFEGHADDLTLESAANAAHYVADERPDAVAASALELFARH